MENPFDEERQKIATLLREHRFVLEPDVEMMMLIALIGRRVQGWWQWVEMEGEGRHSAKAWTKDEQEKEIRINLNSSGTLKTRNEGSGGWEEKCNLHDGETSGSWQITRWKGYFPGEEKSVNVQSPSPRSHQKHINCKASPDCCLLICFVRREMIFERSVEKSVETWTQNDMWKIC